MCVLPTSSNTLMSSCIRQNMLCHSNHFLIIKLYHPNKRYFVFRTQFLRAPPIPYALSRPFPYSPTAKLLSVTLLVILYQQSKTHMFAQNINAVIPNNHPSTFDRHSQRAIHHSTKGVNIPVATSSTVSSSYYDQK